MPSTLRQVKIYLTPGQYEKLSSIAARRGVTPSRLVKEAALRLLGEDGGWEDVELEERVRYLELRYEQLAKEVGRIEKDLMRLKRGAPRAAVKHV